MFAPIEDRDAKGRVYSQDWRCRDHLVAEARAAVQLRSGDGQGRTVDFGTAALMRNLAKRGLLKS